MNTYCSITEAMSKIYSLTVLQIQNVLLFNYQFNRKCTSMNGTLLGFRIQILKLTEYFESRITVTHKIIEWVIINNCLILKKR